MIMIINHEASVINVQPPFIVFSLTHTHIYIESSTMSCPPTSFGFKPPFLTETLSLFRYQVSQLWSVIIPNKPGSETHYNDH